MLDYFDAAMIMMAEDGGIKPVETTSKVVRYRAPFAAWEASMTKGNDDYPLSKVKIDVQNKVYTNDFWDQLQQKGTVINGWGCPWYTVYYYRCDGIYPDIKNYWYTYKGVVENGQIYSGYTEKRSGTRIYCAVFHTESFQDTIEGKSVQIDSYLPRGSRRPVWITALSQNPFYENIEQFNEPGSSVLSGKKIHEIKYTPLFINSISGIYDGYQYNSYYKDNYNNVYYHFCYGFQQQEWYYTYKEDGTVDNVDYTNRYYTNQNPTSSDCMQMTIQNPWFSGNIIWTSVDKHTLIHHMKRFKLASQYGLPTSEKTPVS